MILDRTTDVLLNILLASALLGLVTAYIAHVKGHSIVIGWLLGAASCSLVGLGAIVPAIIMAYMWPPNQAELDKRDWEAGTLRLCPYCGEFIKKDVQFCKHCRHEVGGKHAVFIAEPKTVLLPKTCPYCAAQIKAGATYCRYCGHTLASVPSQALTEDEVAVQNLIAEFVSKYGYVYQSGLVANSVILTHIEGELAKHQPKAGEATTSDAQIAELQDLARRFRQALVKIGQLPPAAIPIAPDARVFVAGRDS